MFTVTVKTGERESIKTFDDFNAGLQDVMLASYLVGNISSIQMTSEDGRVLWSNKELEEGQGGAVDGDRTTESGADGGAGEDGL
jgi:hypothetical protein